MCTQKIAAIAISCVTNSPKRRKYEEYFSVQVVAKFQSARLTGLDSRDGVLLLGVTHFYVIEGVTLLNGGGLIDIESAPEG